MAFPRARIKRFNEMADNTPGVGAYNVTENKQGHLKELDKSRYLSKLDLSTKQLRDKGCLAAARGELPKHVDNLHQQLRATEEKIIDLEILKIGAEKGKEMLQTECRSLTLQIIEMKEVINKLELKIKHMKEKLTELEKEKSQLESENKELLQEKKDFSVDLDNTTSLLAVVKLENKEKQEKINELVQSQLKLEEKISKLENDKSLLTNEIDVLTVRLNTGRLQADKFEQNILVLECEVENFETSIENLTSERQELLSQFKKCEESLSERNHNLLEVQQKIESLEQNRDSLLEVVESLKSENNNLSLERDNINKKLNKLECDIADCQIKLLDVEEKHKVCENELLETDTRYQSLSEQRAQEVSELQAKVSSLESFNAHLSTQISNSENMKNASEKNYYIAVNEIEVRNKQIAEFHQQLDNLNKILDQERVKSEDFLQLQSVNEMLASSLSARDQEITLLNSKHKSTLVALEEQMRQEYEKLNMQRSEQYLKDVTLIEEKRQAFEVELKQSYEEKVAKLEDLKNDFEAHQKQLYEERKNQLDIEKAEFEYTQKKLLGEKLKDLEEKTTKYEVEKSIFNEKEKFLEDEKIKFETQKLLLEEKVKSLEESKDKMTSEYHRVIEELSLTFEEKSIKLEASKKEFENELEQIISEKIQVIENEKEVFMMQQQQKLMEQLQTIEEDKRNFCEGIQLNYNEKLQLLEEERIVVQKDNDYVKQQNEKWKEQERIMEEYKINFQKEMKLQYGEKLHNLEEKVEQEKLKQKLLNEQLQELEMESGSLNITLKEKTEMFEHQIVEVNKGRQMQHDSDLFEIERLKLENETIKASHMTSEKKRCDLATENQHLCGLTELLQDEIARISEDYESYKTRQDAKYKKLTEAADREKDGLNNIISEMSEKIQQMEEGREETDLAQSWKNKYEELEKRMEPFKEILETYELERKLIQDRDRYTNEQIEKLTKEAIKNMGHQNHRQKLKYMEKLKQEHIALQKKLCETQEELQRQNAAMRKYQEKLEKYESTKDLSIKKTPAKPTPVKPRIPLKEGNR